MALSYPLIRRRDENLTATGVVFVEDVKSRVLDQPFTDDRIRGVRGKLGYDRADSYGGINLLHGTLSQGVGGFGGTREDNPLASRTGGHPEFTKLEVLASRQQSLQALMPGLSLYGSAYSQFAWHSLLLPEQCSFGGRSFGRAFDPSALTGDRCVSGLAEVRFDPTFVGNPFRQFQVYGFVDAGAIERLTHAAGTLPHQWASSAGSGVRIHWREHLSANVEAGRSIAGDVDLGWRGHVELTVRY